MQLLLNFGRKGVHIMYTLFYDLVPQNCGTRIARGGSQVGFVIMTNGNETTDFAVTIDLAKKLAMQVRTEKGEMVRNYFLECEKRLKEQTQQIIDSNIEAKIRALKYVIDRTSLAPVAREALLITTAEEVIGVEIPYRPQLEKRTYSASTKKWKRIMQHSSSITLRLKWQKNLLWYYR